MIRPGILPTFDRVTRAALSIPPVLAGVILGANQTRAGAFLPWGLSVAYWIVIAVATWWLIAFATSVTRIVLRPWQPPQWVIWLGGALIGSLFARPVIYAIADVFRPFMQSPILRDMRPVRIDADFVAYYFANWSVIIVLWVATCWLEQLWRSRSAEPDTRDTPVADVAGAAPIVPSSFGFLGRLPPSLGRDIVALEAEDHYVRVHTRLGSTLVLTTIADAVATAEAAGYAGQRVHRSWWIAHNALSQSEVRGRRWVAVLCNGLEVPVSQSYRDALRTLLKDPSLATNSHRTVTG